MVDEQCVQFLHEILSDKKGFSKNSKVSPTKVTKYPVKFDLIQKIF